MENHVERNIDNEKDTGAFKVMQQRTPKHTQRATHCFHLSQCRAEYKYSFNTPRAT